MRTAAPLLLPIFRSAGQAEVLAAIFLAERPLSFAEIAARAGQPYASAHREVKRLLDAGLVSDSRIGNTHQVGPDTESPYYANLRGLLETAFGPVPVLRELLGGVAGVDVVAIFGSYADRASGVPGDPPDDLDILVVGEAVDLDAVYSACATASERLRRDVRPVVLGVEEWAEDSGFLRQVRESPIIEVLGHLPEVRAAT